MLFNRFYAPDIDLLTLRVTRSLPLSTAAELPLSLVWIALLSRRVTCSLAASRGVESDVEVVKYLLVGADVVMTASALLRHGPQHVATMRDGLERWLFANGFDSVDAIRGLKDATHVEHVDALIRAQYVAALTDYLPASSFNIQGLRPRTPLHARSRARRPAPLAWLARCARSQLETSGRLMRQLYEIS